MHNTWNRSRAPRRSGMTLIELLVVVGIVSVLLTIGVIMWPNMADRQQVANGSDQLQQWLLTGRQWALRDQQPRGVRLTIDPNGNGSTVTQLQYIGGVSDFSGGTLVTGPPPSGANTTQNIFVSNVDVTGGWYNPNQNAQQNAQNAAYWLVQPNDKIEILVGGTGQMSLITSVTPTSGTTATLTVAPATPFNNFTTSNYQIHRAPRPLPGEKALELPTDIVIDLALSYPAQGNWISRNQTYDILFSPAGDVILDTASGATPGKIILWVRDGSVPALKGEQRLIAVYTNNGAVAAHPVNSGNNYSTPYSFVQDGKGSGM